MIAGMTKPTQAVVIGASMAGLLAARALSETFHRVVVVERDLPPDDASDRRGVPQGKHLHGLLVGDGGASDGGGRRRQGGSEHSGAGGSTLGAQDRHTLR